MLWPILGNILAFSWIREGKLRRC